MRWSQVGLVVGMLACAGTSKQKPVTASEEAHTQAVPAPSVLTVLARDAEGHSLADIAFRIRQAMGKPTGVFWGVTDAQGQARLTVPSGWYVFTAEVSGYQAFVDPDVRLGREHPATVTMTLQRATSISGRVVDGAGQPIPAVSLSWIPADTTAPRLEGVGSSEGRFRIDGVGPGRGVLRVSRKGFSDERWVFEAPPPELTLGLREQGTLRVTAFGPDGLPVQAPKVEILALEHVAQEGRWVDEHVTDARVYRGLEAGRYRVTFTHRMEGYSFWSTSSEVEIVAGQTRELVLRFGGVKERAPLQGRVIGANGKPSAGMLLSARSGDAERDAFVSTSLGVTDAEGRFTLVHLSRGPVLVTVDSANANVEFDPDAEDVSLAPRPNLFVEGRVRGPDGRPLTRFRVDSEVFEDPEGRYRYRLAGPWPQALTFEAEGFLHTRRRVVPTGERSVLPDVVMETGRTVRGRLLRQDGHPARVNAWVDLRAPVKAESTFIHAMAPMFVGADGRFKLDTVPRQPLILDARSDDGGTASQLLDADVEEVTVRLAPDVILLGTVADEAGRPLQGFRMTTGCDAPSDKRPETDAEGRFRWRTAAGRECVLRVFENGGPSNWPSPPLRVFWPQRITGRSGEVVQMDLRPRKGPASVHVSFPDADLWTRVVLVQGDVPIPSTMQAMEAMVETAVEPDLALADPRPERMIGGGPDRRLRAPEFSELPLGHYTVFVLDYRADLTVLRHPVNLTAPGVFTLETTRPSISGVHFVR